MRSISPSWVSTRSSSDLFQSFSCSVCSCSLSACCCTVACAVSSSRLFWSTSVNSRALRIASTAWWAKVCIRPIRFGGKLAGASPQHHQRAQDARLVDQRHHQHRMEAGRDRDIAQRMLGGCRDRQSRSARRSRRPRRAGVVARRWRDGCLRPTCRCRSTSVRLKLAIVGIIAVDQHGVGMGDLERARRDRRQHGVEVERGGDGAADLFEHLQLVDRLRQIARALLHLLFEVGIGFAAAGRPCC